MAPPAAQMPGLSGSERQRLADMVRRRGIRRVAYFHCDHFEPWRPGPAGQGLPENAADVARFAERSAANPFARRLTLFYKPLIGASPAVGKPGALMAGPGDAFAFAPRAPKAEALMASAMGKLVAATGHDIQLHLHHERYTFNHGHGDPAMAAAFAAPEVRALDSRRMELGLRCTLDAIRRETGLPLYRWFFVHGKWALNGSDPDVCWIADEIEILMRNGCRGDFSFPAGRQHVDPCHEQPFFMRPHSALRAYDRPEAEPEIAFGNGSAVAREKFFIWASRIRHPGSSLDYFAGWVTDRLADPAGWAAEIIAQGYVADGTLFFKTHGHSMHRNYWREGEEVVFIHDHPGVKRLLGTVFDAAGDAGAEIAMTTVSEVFDAFVAPRAPPPGGFTIAMPIAAAQAVPVPARLAHADRINRIAAGVVHQKVAELAGDVAAVGEFYVNAARAGHLLTAREQRIAAMLAAQAPRFDRVIEIGAGMGTLSACCAANALPAVAVEWRARRLELAAGLRTALADELPEAAALFEVRRGTLPQVLGEVAAGNSALVFANIAGPIGAGSLARLLTRARAFRAIIVDLALFFERRDAAGQQALLKRFADAGWPAPSAFSADPRDSLRLFCADPVLPPLPA